MFIQKWNHGEILKTLRGRYVFVMGGKKSDEYANVDQLVKGERSKSIKKTVKVSHKKTTNKVKVNNERNK